MDERLIQSIRHTAVSSDAGYGTIASATFDVTVLDGDTPGVYVDETDGSTLVVRDDPDSPGPDDTYSIRLTQAPVGSVTVSLLTDGQTIVGSADSRYSNGVGGPQVAFNSTNWWIPAVIGVDADLTFVPPTGQPTKEFAIEPHATNRLAGPLSSRASSRWRRRSLVRGGSCRTKSTRRCR